MCNNNAGDLNVVQVLGCSDRSLPWLALPSWSGRWVYAVPRFAVEIEYPWTDPAPPPQTASCCLESATGGTRMTRCRRGSPETKRLFKAKAEKVVEALQDIHIYWGLSIPLGCWRSSPGTTSGRRTLSSAAGSRSDQLCSAQPLKTETVLLWKNRGINIP